LFNDFFHDIPYLLDISTILIFLLFFEIGYLIGKIRRKREGPKSSEAISPATASILGLFAFILAFSFSLSAQKFDTRKQNVRLEANAIGTAYLRTDLLQDPYRSKIKILLREYTDTKLKYITSEEYQKVEYLDKLVILQDQVWSEMLEASKEANNATIELMVTSLNELFDMNSNRIAASIYNRNSGNMWLMLFSVGVLGLLMTGIQAGLNGPRRYIGIIPLILAFTIIFSLIEDLDNPQRGMFKVGQQPLIDVHQNITR